MEEKFEEIRLIKEKHNEILSELEKSSEILKGQCCEIDEELNIHNEVLGEITQTIDKNQEMMEKVALRLEKLLEKYSNNSFLCTIFVLLIVLILVIFL